MAEGLKHPVPQHANPADHALDLVNTDFMTDSTGRTKYIDGLAKSWASYLNVYPDGHAILPRKKESRALRHPLRSEYGTARERLGTDIRVSLNRTWILMERNALNYSRNLLAYGVRIGMYREFPHRV